MTALTLSHDQQEAIERIDAWWKDPERIQVFSLAGYAGTGKTTIISRVIERMTGKVVVAAPTGKAALRLRQKGVKASTIHMLAYKLVGENEKGELLFDYKGIQEGQQLVIVDEASMINKKIFDDLVNDGYRMLFVGDHGQLPPVGTDPGIMRNPDFTLSVIHRQNDSGLLDFAHGLREGRYLNQDVKGAVRILDRHDNQKEAEEALTSADTVLCYKNSTRHTLNLGLMQQRGLIESTDWETPLDLLRALLGKTFRIVGLRNNYKIGFFNGQLGDLTLQELEERAGYEDSGEPTYLGIGVLKTEDNREMRVLVDLSGFLRDGKGADQQPFPKAIVCDFGYALTCHKSQGSEWDTVTVFDDTFPSMKEHSRWCYTAATRAKKQLNWVT